MAEITLICLNSEQVVANVVALGEIKPDKLVIISTEDMTEQFLNLCACAKALGIIPPEKPVMVPPWDFEEIERALTANMPAIDPQESIVLNATGGTKPMALVTLEHFKTFPNLSAVYIDSRNNRIYRFSPGPPQKYPLSFQPSISMYLRAYGLNCTFQNPEPWLDQVSPFLGNHFESLIGLIWKIKKSWGAEGGPLRMSGIHSLHPRSTWSRFLSLLQQQGVVRGFSQKGEVLEILWEKVKEAQHYFVHCGWLEHLIFFYLKNISDETGLNIKVDLVKETGGSVLAEYDVVARKGASLWFFECKAGSAILDRSQLGQAVQSFQSKVKLSGGVTARPVFVLSNRLRGPSEVQLARAQFAGVRVISYEDIRDRLSETLEEILLPFPEST